MHPIDVSKLIFNIGFYTREHETLPSRGYEGVTRNRNGSLLRERGGHSHLD
jgi:hypothetical protein